MDIWMILFFLMMACFLYMFYLYRQSQKMLSYYREEVERRDEWFKDKK